ncbi:hypothetical protein ACJIZ3_021439 [Penstemon smallii]|uniref:RING-CH-type domain-containing protein n=1 Tax=Penstemon smallii TaxID=265156 RepID=A0ABD3SLF7_9LAMI
MGDHFVLLVDRLLTESTLEAAIQSRNSLKQAETFDEAMIDSDAEGSLSPRKIVECRICQDEDFDSRMETPCSCRGSLKYAHRKCIQRWCNEKGDTMCEICHQQFMPGYTAPPPIFRLGGLPMNLRGNWQISRSDLNNPRIINVFKICKNIHHSNIYRSLWQLLMLRIVGIIIPSCIILKAVSSILRRRNHQASLSFSPYDEEDGLFILHQSRVIAVR